MWQVELVEGKDAPPERAHLEDSMGKTVGLLLRLWTRRHGSTALEGGNA